MALSNPLTKYGVFGWNYKYLLLHPWRLVEESYYHTKWFFQRGWRGYADCDVWDLGGYLLQWLPPAIRQLKRGLHGYPCDLSLESWEYILEKMADGLEAERKWTELDYETERERIGLQRRGKDGMRLFMDHFHDLWD